MLIDLINKEILNLITNDKEDTRKQSDFLLIIKSIFEKEIERKKCNNCRNLRFVNIYNKCQIKIDYDVNYCSLFLDNDDYKKDIQVTTEKNK
jgi:hypothetical protein